MENCMSRRCTLTWKHFLDFILHRENHHRPSLFSIKSCSLPIRILIHSSLYSNDVSNVWTMYSTQIISLLCFFAVSGLVSGAAIAQPVSIERRSIQMGWSLQASTCPSGASSCGNGACCPSTLFCIANANDEVDACCTTSKSYLFPIFFWPTLIQW